MSSEPVTQTGGGKPANHVRRMIVIWLVASVIATPLVVLLFAPIVPPGNGSEQASGQGLDNAVLFGISTPVVLAVLVFFAYALIVFRQRTDAAIVPTPPKHRAHDLQLAWIVVTSTIVLVLAVFASYRLLRDGAGGGQGPNPIAKLDTHGALPVQVIGQQWQFTYRYPTYGGLETPHLVLPADKTIVLHVTSLDAIHSFWAYQLGVKADANPGVDNVAYLQTRGPRSFDVHCAELCGLWHGYMFDTGRVVPEAQFTSWIQHQQAVFAPVKASLTPYATSYFPAPERRGG